MALSPLVQFGSSACVEGRAGCCSDLLILLVLVSFGFCLPPIRSPPAVFPFSVRLSLRNVLWGGSPSSVWFLGTEPACSKFRRCSTLFCCSLHSLWLIGSPTSVWVLMRDAAGSIADLRLGRGGVTLPKFIRSRVAAMGLSRGSGGSWISVWICSTKFVGVSGLLRSL